MDDGVNPVGCTLAPVLSIQPEAAHRMVAWATIQSGALLHPHLIDRRSHTGWALEPIQSGALLVHPFYPSSPEGALRMDDGVNPVGHTLSAPSLNQPGYSYVTISTQFAY